LTQYPLLSVVHAQTISAWPPTPCSWYWLLQGCDGRVTISFPVSH